MKVLILSCATGEGHNSAAKAYMEYLKSQNMECKMRDTLEKKLSAEFAVHGNVNVPGCETRNAEFFHYHGMSYSTGDIAQQAAVAMRLVEDKPYRGRKIQSQKENMNPHTCEEIMAL